MKKRLSLIIILFFGLFSNIYSQKGVTKPTNSNLHSSSSLSCPLSVSIQDNIPAAVCSELLKTLVAVTSPCTDTTAVNYRWSSSIGGVFSTSRTTTFNLPEFFIATNVTFTVWVIEGRDSLSANYTINIKPRPNSPSLTPFGTIVLCDSNPVLLTSSVCTGGSTTVWSNGASGVNAISVPAIGGTYYSVACYKNGCISDSTAAAAFITGSQTTPPTTVSRTICEGTSITIGNGLQAQLVNCGNTGASGTYTYTGPTVGYDDGFRNNGGIDPSVVVPGGIGLVSKVKISITWRKQKGGFQNDCGVGDTQTWPYHNETQFRIKSPSGKIINLVYTGSYGGSNNPTVTTVFEDGMSPINYYSPPVSGTFSPAQPLSGFIGEDAAGTWTLLPYDAVWKDPLCVSGFAITLVPNVQNGTVTWWDAPIGGNQVGTGNEFIPSATTTGTYTYYAQGQCALGCPSARTASTLTIQPTPSAPTISVSVPEVNNLRSICTGESITLTATGCNNGGTVRWNSSYNGTNFATGSSYTFIPTGSNSSNVNHTFTAICEGSNLCRSVNSPSLSVIVKYKPSQPTIFGLGASICANSSVTLTASACSGGTLGWTGNRSGSSITFNLTSSVNIKTACTINGCTSDSSNVYSISSLPKPTILTVNSSQVQALCYGSSVTLTASTCVGTVKWTGNLSGSPITVTPLSSRNYKASCLSSNGCSSDSSSVINIVVLPKTKPTISGNTFVCGISSVTLTASGCSGANETVVWRDESTGAIFTETISQTKTFRAVCIRNGYCVSDSSDIFTVQYRVKPSQPIITPPANTTICQGTSVSLTASACAGGTSGWTGGLTGQTVSVSPNTSKNHKVACVINGCVSDSSLAVSLMVKSKPTQPIINQINPTICAGQNIVLSVVMLNGAFYNWTGGLSGTSISVSPSVTKTYKVVATVNDCVSDSASVVISVGALPTAPSIRAIDRSCLNNIPVKVWDKAIQGSFYITKSLLSNTNDTYALTDNNYLYKFSNSGQLLWTNTPLNSPTSSSLLTTPDLLIDNNNIYLAISENLNIGNASDYIFSKINQSGSRVLQRVYKTQYDDFLRSILKTSDNNFLLGGYSAGFISADKTQDTKGRQDYWIIKVDSVGNKIWDKDFGGIGTEYFSDMKKISGGSFLLGGFSNSGISGDKSQLSFGNYDFWIVKIDAIGNKIWDKAFGGSEDEYLKTIVNTDDGGFLLGGDSYSGISGTKTGYLRGGSDYWIVKIDANGNKVWDKTFGGINDDKLSKIVRTVEGNFILAGTSYSGQNGDNTSTPKGGGDYWVIKIDANGNKIWDKSYGGSSDEQLFDLNIDSISNEITASGASASSISGDKSQNSSTGYIEPWILKIIANCPDLISISICKGDSVSLKANNCVGTVNWSNGSIGSTIITKPIVTTNYTATCTNSNGCISPLSSAFTVSVSTPSIPIITPPTNSTICQGSNITLSATGCTGGTFAWTGGLTGTSISVSPSATKAYKVACTLNTCTSDSSLAVMINVTPAPVSSLNSSKTSICSGDSATLTISGCIGSIIWSNGATTSVIKVSPAINTTFTATCAGSPCSSTQSVSITVLSAPSVTASSLLQCGQTVTLTANNVPAGSTIQWRKDGVDIAGANNSTLIVGNAGNYDFTVGATISTQLQINTTSSSDIRFVDSNNGYVLNTNNLWKTTNGGTNWVNVYSHTSNFEDVYFVDSNNGWAITQQNILKTTNGGLNWTINNNYWSGLTLSKMTFKSLNTGIIITNDARSLSTTNGGLTWTLNTNPVESNVSSWQFKKLLYIPNTNNILLAYRSNGTTLVKLIKSIDNGTSWTTISFPNVSYFSGLEDISFVDSNNGWLVGYEYDKLLMKTVDGGNTWTRLNPIMSSGNYNKIDFITPQIGYVQALDYSTFNNRIFKTKDGGNTWNIFKNIDNNSNYLNTNNIKIEFLSEDNGWYATQAPNTNQSFLNKISTPQCPTIPKVIPNNCCNGLETLKSGSWTDPTTWSCNRVPTSTDDIFINTGHTITDNGNTIHAKTLNYRGGILQLSTITNFILR